jgi:predicted dehydrogenase
VTHLLDLARVFLGEATAIGAAGHQARMPGVDFPDTVVAHLAFSSGALSTLTATCAAEAPTPPSLELVTPSGSATIDDVTVKWTGRPALEPSPPVDPYQVETDAFIAAVASGDPASIRIDVQEALQTHALACGIQAAAAVHMADPAGSP